MCANRKNHSKKNGNNWEGGEEKPMEKGRVRHADRDGFLRWMNSSSSRLPLPELAFRCERTEMRFSMLSGSRCIFSRSLLFRFSSTPLRRHILAANAASISGFWPLQPPSPNPRHAARFFHTTFSRLIYGTSLSPAILLVYRNCTRIFVHWRLFRVWWCRTTFWRGVPGQNGRTNQYFRLKTFYHLFHCTVDPYTANAEQDKMAMAATK